MKRITLVAALLAVLATGCSQFQETSSPGGNAAPGDMTAGSTAPQAAPRVKSESKDKDLIADEKTLSPGGAPQPAQKKTAAKIIKTANLEIRVEDYASSRKTVQQRVDARQGYLQSEQESNDGYRLRNSLTIRVETGQFDPLVDELAGIGSYVHHKNINAQDVTEEFVDLETRLKTKREVEQRYIDILRRANSIPDILSVEGALRQIREEIEAKEGRLRYLSDQVGYSTIHLVMYQQLDHRAEPGPGFWSKIWQGLQGGWEFLLVLLIGLAYLWPLWLVVAIVIWLIRRAIKKNRARKAATAQSAASGH